MSNVDIGRYSKRIVQYFWDPVPKNDDSTSSPIWCLGKKYDGRPQPAASQIATHGITPPVDMASSDSEQSSVMIINPDLIEGSDTPHEGQPQSEVHTADWPTAFLDDFESRLWFTYRSSFPPIPKSQDPKALQAMSFGVRLKTQLSAQGGFTSDSGWGCMIRSGQSLLGNTLLQLRLGRDWRRGVKSIEERRLLSLFADDPKAPFSIHKFVEHGASACGKHPGEWFGPSATARCIQALAHDCTEAGLRVYVTNDSSDVYEDTFLKIAKSADGTFQPTLLLIGTRLGIDGVTPVYWEGLKRTLQLPQSIGIAGGRPSSSHYFVGTQGDFLFYLDPHQTKQALPMHIDASDYTPEEVGSCHTRRLRRIHIKELDPSVLIAFLIKDEVDWQDWRKKVTETPGKSIVHVENTEPAMLGHTSEREAAIDEVESLDEEDDVENRESKP